MGANGLCEYLDWDSQFFGRRIGRVRVPRLTQDRVTRILDWCEDRHIDCLYFLSDADDPTTIRLAEDNGFRLVDIRVTLEAGASTAERERVGATPCLVRMCTTADVPALRRIARTAHQDTRFYWDPHFPSSSKGALYETWIAKSCEGYADAVLVADLDGRSVGYIACTLTGQSSGEIGLFAVQRGYQGNGYGGQLLGGSLRWFGEQGVEHVSVVTQGRNARAQRLYQEFGFQSKSLQLWYHRWFNVSDQGR